MLGLCDSQAKARKRAKSIKKVNLRVTKLSLANLNLQANSMSLPLNKIKTIDMRNLMIRDKSNPLFKKKVLKPHLTSKNPLSRMIRKKIIMNRTLLRNENQIITDIVRRKMQSHLLRRKARGHNPPVDYKNHRDMIGVKTMNQKLQFITLKNTQTMN